MNTLTLTSHAVMRMAQRSIRIEDSELISLIGTEVDDGYLVLDQDCQQWERMLKRCLGRIRRVRGKRLVIADGRIVTAYHVGKRQQRRLLRSASERDLYE